MKAKKYKISLRMRVTLISVSVLTIVCVLLSFLLLYSAQLTIIRPTSVNSQDTTRKTNIIDEYIGIPIPVDPSEKELYEFVQIAIDSFYKYSVIGIIAMWLCGIVLTYIVTGISLKPVTELKNKIASTTPKDLSKRIEGFSAGDELDSLAESFNELFDRIESAFNREKSFSAGAAHELKTPLTVIKTNLDVLNMSEEASINEYTETLAIVQKQTVRMIKLVDDLFAMYVLNDYEIVEKVSIGDLLNDISLDLALGISEKNITIQINETPCFIKANAVMLRHAFSNILQNAIKYNIENGSIDVYVNSKDNICKIVVADTGIGISEMAAAHIFEPFYREDKSRSRKIGGAGLGLSIVKNIVEEHGGTVFYRPNYPNGSIFIVELPII